MHQVREVLRFKHACGRSPGEAGTTVGVSAGNKVFVDFAGLTFNICLADGEGRPAQLFVAVLGASSCTFATLRWSQGLEDWIEPHACALAFFGGGPELVCRTI